MKKLRIGIDVDLTWVDSGKAWEEWLTAVHGVPLNLDLCEPPTNGSLHYNTSKYFPKATENIPDAYEFWEDPYLYDKLKPIAGAAEAVGALKEVGHDILFVSHCKKGHFSSKVRHLKRYAKGVDMEKGTDGFYATKNKAGVKVDVFIDDRHNFLNQFGDDVIKILYVTPYSQDEELKVSVDLRTNDWKEIERFLLDLS